MILPVFVGDLSASGISYSQPSYYSFSGFDNKLYAHTEPYSAIPEGHILHFEYKSFLPIGIESYKVYISEANTEEEKSYIEINFIDVLYRFKYQNLNLFGGIGYGNIEYKCKISACKPYSFKKGTATQLFFQVGIPFTENFDFHLSAHRISGSNEVSIGEKDENINLGGSMAAFGILIKW
ncbi:MAG: hypothetical protein HOC24_15830 [Deltaproteobacteria bacterium]|nr:hypothetical protein [Deltaproteobacteria bacterium]